MSKKQPTAEAPAQEQPNGEAPEANTSTNPASTGEPIEPAAPSAPEAAGGNQEPSAIPDAALQAAHQNLDITAAPAPETVTVRLLFGLGSIPAGKAVTLPASQAAALVAQGDADDHPEAVQYALAQGPAIEYVAE